jgi:predicted ATPase
MTQTADTPPKAPPQPEAQPPLGFTEIGVRGFKSFAEETRIQLGSLTILAGANSSGKSSIMQPLLMMKQTLEAPYDPGALLLDGPNVHFTSGQQMLSIDHKPSLDLSEFMVFMNVNSMPLETTFHWNIHSGPALHMQKFGYKSSLESLEVVELRADMSPDEIVALGPDMFALDSHPQNLRVMRNRCFLKVEGRVLTYNLGNPSFAEALQAIIHLPGLRGTPERLYKTANVTGSTFLGQFDTYVASIINRFQKDEPGQLIKVQEALKKLGLTDIVQAQRLNDAQIELRVGRVLGRADTTDTVNIADVGLGMSQILPVIVALLVAQPGQLVYIEQPEIHLHPRAQIALSEIFADAANRGVRVVVETHSELFLLGIQSLVAEDKLDPNAVKLHWFTRSADGSSQVTSAELDTTGAFGDWPEDFGMTGLALENRYLSAAEAKLWAAGNGRSSH